MRTKLVLALMLGGLLACSPTSTKSVSEGPPRAAESRESARDHEPPAEIDVEALEAAGGLAYFAGGCFWGVEHYMEQLEGVVRVESGYMGGHVEDPSYLEVSSQESGHFETVRVYFDPERVGYREVAKRFFEIHDPTQANGQGPDIGPEYRSAVFVTSPEQRAVVEELISILRDRGYEVVTRIHDAETFWIAEDYHQDYYARHGEEPYCHTRVSRFGDDSTPSK
jgi:peptide methionine sulfoxide reductase msrA/msrB